MDVSESQALFLKFAEPLASYAAFSAERKKLADMLAQNLWKALIAGPQAEDTMWDVLTNEGTLDAEQLEPIKACYYKQMKPTVSQDQLVVLRAKYGVRYE